MDHPSLARDRLGYVPALDGLRGLAVLAVLFFHLFTGWGMWAGAWGVAVFFVLSGFLITTLLVDEWKARGQFSLAQFWRRRLLRLVPAQLLVLAAVFPFVPLAALLAAATYSSNWAMWAGWLRWEGPLVPTWSLAIEAQFYLVWPFVLRVILEIHTPRRRVLVPLTLAIAVAVARLVLYAGEGSPATYNTLYHVDLLLVGAALALARAFAVLPNPASSRRAMNVLATGTLLGFAYLVTMARWTAADFYHLGVILVALGTTVWITHVLFYPDAWLARALRWAPFVRVGVVSYGLYLWHFPLYTAVRAFGLQTTELPGALMAVAISLSIALLSYRWIEQPALRLKVAARRSPRPISIPNSP